MWARETRRPRRMENGARTTPDSRTAPVPFEMSVVGPHLSIITVWRTQRKCARVGVLFTGLGCWEGAT